MKKVLCVFMSVLMIFSSALVMSVGAAGGYAANNPITDSFWSYDEFVAENSSKEIYGYTYDFLYESTSYVDWTKLDIFYQQDGQEIQSTKNSIALAKSDMNAYLKRVLNNFFLGDKLYTEEYATMLVNIIGKLIYPNFTEKTVDFGTNETPNEEDFFEIVADESGLTEIIQLNWCDANIDFKSFITAFGVNLNNIVSNKYGNGHVIATELIRAAVQKILTSGPIDYIIDVLWTFSKNYTSNLYDATTSLFRLKINAGSYTVEEINSIEGILNIALKNVTDYEFVKFPKTRLTSTSDLTEAQLFLMIYFAINYNYKNNAAVVDGLSAKINSFIGKQEKYSAAGYSAQSIETVKTNISNIIDCVLKGNISIESINMLNSLTQENIDSKPADLLTAFMNSIAKIFRKIADYFDYVFKVLTGEIEYGKPY